MATFEELIAIKRDGGKHSSEQIERLMGAYVDGRVPDYQMAAWLMAAFLRGLDADETLWLTDAMARSGRTIDLGSVPGTPVDKHSTGGVGDKTTMVLAPLVAACGVPVAKMSGRGLGHTGGTLDKLESIPGFRVDLEPDAFARQVGDVGCAVMAQLDDVDPADKKLYALRDVTATVPAVPLIVASIISKKVAGGAGAILLDVKVGSGAFMKSEEDARVLARELKRVGEALGPRVRCVLSDMDQPLGTCVGNAIEVREAISTLRGEGPADLTELCIELAARMVAMADGAQDVDAGRALAVKALDTGSALERFGRWVEAQGGDRRVADDDRLLELSPLERVVSAPSAGFVTGFDAEGVGRAALALGAGRTVKDERIDRGAGIRMYAKAGDELAEGDALATVYSSSEAMIEDGVSRLLSAVRMGEGPPADRSLVQDV